VRNGERRWEGENVRCGCGDLDLGEACSIKMAVEVILLLVAATGWWRGKE
jgi:hypothetical protein